MTGPVARDVLWSHTDGEEDTARLLRGGFNDDENALAHLVVWDGVVNLDHDAVRRLRNACDRLLTGAPHTAPEAPAAVALHAAQHVQLEAAARRFAGHVDGQVNAVAGLVDQVRVIDEESRPDVAYVPAGLVHQLAVQQQRTACSLADLLAALAGEA